MASCRGPVTRIQQVSDPQAAGIRHASPSPPVSATSALSAPLPPLDAAALLWDSRPAKAVSREAIDEFFRLAYADGSLDADDLKHSLK